MEGKEVALRHRRHAASSSPRPPRRPPGSVNAMHDSLTPMGGFVPIALMMLNCVFGGDGVGLINLVQYAILAVFLVGMMIGRSPEFLGKKIEAREIKLVMLAVLAHRSSSSALPRVARRLAGRQEQPQQHGPPRVQRGPLRVHVRHGEQRFCIRRPQRQYAVLQHDDRPRHAGRSLPDDAADARRRRLRSRAEDRFRPAQGPFARPTPLFASR